MLYFSTDGCINKSLTYLPTHVTVVLYDCCSASVGGTAVGTGINTQVGFAEKVAAKVAEFTGENCIHPFNLLL